MCDRVLGFGTWTYCPNVSIVDAVAVVVAVALPVDDAAAVADHAKWVQTQHSHWYHSTGSAAVVAAAVDADMVASVVVLAALACPPSLQ
jgi:hypothetical protein